jgi:hypothetical protein
MANLGNEQLISFEIRPRVDFRRGSQRAIYRKTERRKIEYSFATVADNLTLPSGRGLQIILMQVDGKRSPFSHAFHQDARSILHVDFQMTKVSTARI